MPATQWITGRKSSIGTTALQMVSTEVKATTGVQIYAASDNAAAVYVGLENLTTDSADATDGFPLAAGESIFIPTRNPEEIYVKAASGTLKVWFIVV